MAAPDILRGGAGAGASAATRGAKPPGYTPLEREFPGYINEIEANTAEGKSEDYIRTKILADIQALRDSGKYSESQIQEYISQPADRSMLGQVKAVGKMLWEGLTQPQTQRTKEKMSEGMVSGATFDYYQPGDAPQNRQEYIAKEFGQFIGSLGQGVNVGGKVSQGGRLLYGAGKTFAGRTAQGLAENLAAGAAIEAARARPADSEEGRIDISGRLEAAKSSLTDPLNLALSAGGGALGAAVTKPAPSGASQMRAAARAARARAAAEPELIPPRRPQPPPPPGAPPAPPTQPPPVGAPPAGPAARPPDPTLGQQPTLIHREEMRYQQQQAATLADQQRGRIAEARARIDEIERAKQAAAVRATETTDPTELAVHAGTMEVLSKQGVEAEKALVNLQRSQVFVATTPRTEEQLPPRRTITLGGKVVVDPTPPGQAPRLPEGPSDQTILGMAWNDIMSTGVLSDETQALASQRALRSRSFNSAFDKEMLRADKARQERIGPPPIGSKSGGRQMADWIIKQFDEGYNEPNLTKVDNDSLVGGVEYLREFVSGTRGEKRLDVEGYRPAWFVREPKGPRSYSEEYRAGTLPNSVHRALMWMEKEVTDRGLDTWWKVPLRATEDIELATHAVEHGVHPTKGHRVELFFDGPEGKAYSFGKFWITPEEFADVRWQGKLKLLQDIGDFADMNETEIMIQQAVNAIKQKAKAEYTRPRGAPERPGGGRTGAQAGKRPDLSPLSQKAAKSPRPPLAGVADFMKFTGFDRPLAERIFKALMPEVDIDIIRDPARVQRFDDLSASLKRRGYDVGDLERERAAFDGYTEESWNRYFAREITQPGEVSEARPPGRSVVGTERWRDAVGAADEGKFPNIVAGDETHKIVTYTPEGQLRKVVNFSGSAEEARQAFGRAKAADPGATMELLRVSGQVAPERLAPSEMPKPTPPTGPPTHQIDVFQDGRFVGSKDFFSDVAANAYKDFYTKIAEQEGASITMEVRPYAPTPRAPEPPPEPVFQPRERPAQPTRPPVQKRGELPKKEEVRVPARPEEQVPQQPKVETRASVEQAAEARGYKLNLQAFAGQPTKYVLSGPDGRFTFDDLIKAGQFIRNKFGTGATASDIDDVARGRPTSQGTRDRVRQEQNTIQPNATRNPMPPNMPDNGVTLGMFMGVPPGFEKVLPRIYKDFQAYRTAPALYGAMMNILRAKAKTPQEFVELTRHVLDTEAKVPGTINSFLAAAEQRVVFDNYADWIGQPQSSSNPFARLMSTDALFSLDIPRLREMDRQLKKIEMDYGHLTPAQVRATWLDSHGIVASHDPVVIRAVQAHKDWGDDIRQMANLPNNWDLYIAGATNKQTSYSQVRNQFLGHGPDFNQLPADLKSWFKGPDEYARFFRHLEKQELWDAVPRSSRDLINKNWLTWDTNSPSYLSLSDEVKDIIPPGAWHKFALHGGQPNFQSVGEFQRAIMPEIMDAVFVRPYLERWQPIVNLFDENQGIRHWSNSYNQMVVGGSERAGWVRGVDDGIRMLENVWGTALADDNFLDNLARRINTNMYRTLLGGALDSAVRNSSSIITNFAEFGPTRIMKALVHHFNDGAALQLYKDTVRNSGIMTDVMWDLHYGRPGVPRDGNAFRNWFAEHLGLTREKYDLLDQQFTRLVMSPMHWTDNVGKGMAIMAALDEGLQQGMPAPQIYTNAMARLATIRPDYQLGAAQQEAVMRMMRTQFGHMPSTQSLAYRNPLARSSFMFWNYPSKLAQLGLAESWYDAWRVGAPEPGMRYMRYLAWTGLMLGGAYLGKEIGLDLGRVFGSGLFPSFASPVIQWPGNLIQLTVGDSAIPDDKWSNMWQSALGGLAGIPTRYPMKVAGGIEAAEKGRVENAYGKTQYETNGWIEFMRMIGIEYGDTYRDRDLIRLAKREEREYATERRNAIGQFVKSGGTDTRAVDRFNVEWGKKSGGKVITGETLNNAMRTGRIPRVYEVMRTPIGQRIADEIGATP